MSEQDTKALQELARKLGNETAFGAVTLRDYFAASALPGVVRKYGYSELGCARSAYEQADKMLLERLK